MDFNYLILSAVCVFVALTVHEYAHGYAAYKLGDNTARNLGRLTLNPIKHIDPIGALCLLFFHFGWAKPVPINPRYFKNPRRDFAISALMGPIANLLLAFFSAFLYLLTLKWFINLNFSSGLLYNIAYNTLSFVAIFHSVNVGLAIFNLFPIPPLDGSRIVTLLLPPNLYFKIMKYERVIFWILAGWLFIGNYISTFLLSFDFIIKTPLLRIIAKIFSLSGLLSSLMGFVSDLMLDFWRLIPFLNFSY